MAEEIYKNKAVCRIYGYSTGKFWYTLHVVQKGVEKETLIGGTLVGPAFGVVYHGKKENDFYDSAEEAFKACESKAKGMGIKIVKPVSPQKEPKDKMGHTELARLFPRIWQVMVETGKVFDFKPGALVRKALLGKLRARIQSPKRLRQLRARYGRKAAK